jgi:hypothetical protein
MANETRLGEIEQRIEQLSFEEQEQLAHWLQTRLSVRRRSRPEWDKSLASMAADPEIQRELRQIDAEFSVADADGLD